LLLSQLINRALVVHVLMLPVRKNIFAGMRGAVVQARAPLQLLLRGGLPAGEETMSALWIAVCVVLALAASVIGFLFWLRHTLLGHIAAVEVDCVDPKLLNEIERLEMDYAVAEELGYDGNILLAIESKLNAARLAAAVSAGAVLPEVETAGATADGVFALGWLAHAGRGNLPTTENVGVVLFVQPQPAVEPAVLSLPSLVTTEVMASPLPILHGTFGSALIASNAALAIARNH
jgi:hypothetical protein